VIRLSALDERLMAPKPAAATPLGWRCFQLGMVLLASSAFLAGLALLLALILGSRGRRPFLADRANLVLLVAAVLMVLGCFRAASNELAWLGLANWLPFFWGFWGFQVYLGTPAARRRVAMAVVAGTVPVILTGLGQIWWGWSGPFQALGGLIIWHIKAGGNPPERLAGLFDYANIAGAWLVLAWPFALAALLEGSLGWRRRGVVLLIAAGLVAAVFLTDSRNAWGALMLAVPVVAGPGSWLWLLPVLLVVLAVIGLATLPWVPAGPQELARQLLPEAIWGRLIDLESGGQRPLAITRLAQWREALGLIAERPWLGWGAAAFSIIYPMRTGFWHGHPHNLPIDLAMSHGVPVAVLVVGLVLWLLLRAVVLGMAGGALYDRAWWAAALVLVALHATDIPLYDSRVNVAGWVLLAGLRAWRAEDQSGT
jgi:hypothetical protein